MFRSSTVIKELALKLIKVIFMLKLSVKLRPYLLCGCVAAYHEMACVLHAVHANKHTHTHTPFHDVLSHNRIINNDVISPNILT